MFGYSVLCSFSVRERRAQPEGLADDYPIDAQSPPKRRAALLSVERGQSWQTTFPKIIDPGKPKISGNGKGVSAAAAFGRVRAPGRKLHAYRPNNSPPNSAESPPASARKDLGPAPSHPLTTTPRPASGRRRRLQRRQQDATPAPRPATWATLGCSGCCCGASTTPTAPGAVSPGIELIATAAKCHRDTVCEALKALEAAGLLTWVNRSTRIGHRERDLSATGAWSADGRISNALAAVTKRFSNTHQRTTAPTPSASGSATGAGRRDLNPSRFSETRM